MAQTLDQIIASLGSVYDPQIQSVQAQRAGLADQRSNDVAALQGQQTNAFNDILNGARSRGTGVAFGGIPLGDQAKYTATTYLPALANLYTSYNTKDSSLQDALNSINENRYNNANSQYQFQVNQDLQNAQLAEQKRQFDANLAEQQRQDEINRQAAAAAASGANYSFGGGGSAAPAAPAAKADPYAKIDKNGAANAVNALLRTNNVALINQTYNAIKQSAAYGNLYDQYKMQLFNSVLHPPSNTAYNPSTAKLLNSAISYRAPAKPSQQYYTPPTSVKLGR